MFKQNKWQAWYESQPQHIKDWMDQPQAIWYDSDMWRAGIFGLVIGVVIGLFESFLVFWMLEVLLLVSVAVWYYYEPKVQKKKIHDPWGFWKE